MTAFSVGQPWMWAAFIVFVLAMLALDLFVFGGRKAHRVSVREALAWVIAWISLALVFAVLLWWYLRSMFGAEIAHPLLVVEVPLVAGTDAHGKPRRHAHVHGPPEGEAVRVSIPGEVASGRDRRRPPSPRIAGDRDVESALR